MPSLYAITVPVFISELRILSALLAKGVASAPTAEAQSTLLNSVRTLSLFPSFYQM